MPDRGPSPIRLLIVDDHALLREGVTLILEDRLDMEVVGVAPERLADVVASTLRTAKQEHRLGGSAPTRS